MRVMILYEHCSPHQVTAVEAARQHFLVHQHELIPVEFYSRSADYGWTLSDKQRSENWLCLFPGKQLVSNSELYRAIVRQVKALSIDVLVINGWYGRTTWWLAFLKAFIGCKLVIVSDSVAWDAPRTWWKELPKKVLLKRFDAGFVAGQPQSQYLQSLGMASNRLSQGNDVVDNALYEAIPIRSNPVNRKMVIGTAARLIPKKNLGDGIRAIAAFKKKHPEHQFEWKIAGRGPLEEELKQLAGELQVPVVFPGYVGYYDMPGFYAGLDLYWQPSSSEPWGLVVNEAMASGLPVLVSDRCGCAMDLVTPATGWIHELGIEGMVHGLDRAFAESHRWPELGGNARLLIQQWDCQRFAQGLLEAAQCATGTHKA